MLSQFEQMLSNPAMQQMMTSMMSDPRMMEQMLGSDPRGAGADANPELRSRLTDPEFLRRMSDPPTFAPWCRCSARWRSCNRAARRGMGPGMGGDGSRVGMDRSRR